MPFSLENLITEILALDPLLRSNEARVRAAVEAMVRGRPETHFRPEFQEELRRRISAEILRRARPSLFLRVSSFLWPFFAGAAATTFVAALLFRPDFLSRAPRHSSLAEPVDVFSVTQREPGAFGSLAFLAPKSAESSFSVQDAAVSADRSEKMVSETKEPAMMALAPAPTTSQETTSSTEKALSDAPENSASLAMINVPTADVVVQEGKLRAQPQDINVRAQPSENPSLPLVPQFIFTGALKIPTGPVVVYHRKSISLSPRLAEKVTMALREDHLPVILPAELKSVTFAQPGTGGLVVTVDTSVGYVMAYRDGGRECPGNDCRPLTVEDIPSDAVILNEASRALTEMGISLKNYGSPTVVRPQLADFPSTAIPEILRVTYPMVVDNLPVYDEWGTPKNLTVDVDVRTVRVSSVNGIDLAVWEASDYPVLKDTATILARVRAGGLRSETLPEGRPMDVPLADPLHAYVVVSVPESGEYLVPALVFPVTAVPQNISVPPAVVVPIVDVFAGAH